MLWLISSFVSIISSLGIKGLAEYYAYDLPSIISIYHASGYDPDSGSYPVAGNNSQDNPSSPSNNSQDNSNSPSYDGEDNSPSNDGEDNHNSPSNEDEDDDYISVDYWGFDDNVMLYDPANEIPEKDIRRYISTTGHMAHHPHEGDSNLERSWNQELIDHNRELRDELRKRKAAGIIPDSPSAGSYQSEWNNEDAQNNNNLAQNNNDASQNYNDSASTSKKRKFESDDESSTQPHKKFK